MKKAGEGPPYSPHRRDWPGFLRPVIPDAVWQAVNRQVQPSGDSGCAGRPSMSLALSQLEKGWRFSKTRAAVEIPFPFLWPGCGNMGSLESRHYARNIHRRDLLVRIDIEV